MLKQKPFFRIFFTCSFFALIPVLFFGLSTWSWMWRTVGLRQGETCARSFPAVSKGTFWDHGEWHHYVDFNVDVSDLRHYRWRITQAPMPSAVFDMNSQEKSLRITYRWPGNFWDPFPLSRWEICRLNS